MGTDSESSVDQEGLRRTTVMIRNIPSEYTRADLLGLLDHQGFNGLYDFVYVPVDFQTELNHGYAFVNLTTVDNAHCFKKQFNGFSDWIVESDRICEVTWTDESQGIDYFIERY